MAERFVQLSIAWNAPCTGAGDWFINPFRGHVIPFGKRIISFEKRFISFGEKKYLTSETPNIPFGKWWFLFGEQIVPLEAQIFPSREQIISFGKRWNPFKRLERSFVVKHRVIILQHPWLLDAVYAKQNSLLDTDTCLAAVPGVEGSLCCRLVVLRKKQSL